MSTATQVEEFLTGYEKALGAFDAEGSAALWGVPATILTDDFAGSLDSRAALAEALSQGYPFYRGLGLARVRHTVLERVDVTPRITRVRVRWHFHAADDEYLLREDDDGLHAYVGVSIDEQQKIAELAQRLGLAPG